MLSEDVYHSIMDDVASLFVNDSSGHDIHHTKRVHDSAVTIQATEGGDIDIIRLASLLHDADDRKLFATENYSNARSIMVDHGISEDMQDAVIHVISQISFKGKDTIAPDTLEGMIVQDADRLDAIGAIGIGRAFAYGGKAGRAMYDPKEHHKEGMSESEYYSNEGTTINHFYEKLLLLKDMMNTETAKRVAEHRHSFMEGFLKEFYDEWYGTNQTNL
ncbi:HD domain-containing protein [Candidatus Methanarcanum hacksteinii]|uniref:HD domain-containing protein n=1 Tax=Candidatus Methanarcanum hacksteinii TaxID=2911857 RepID=UPI0037DD14D5